MEGREVKENARSLSSRQICIKYSVENEILSIIGGEKSSPRVVVTVVVVAAASVFEITPVKSLSKGLLIIRRNDSIGEWLKWVFGKKISFFFSI
jgi:hypothetical protein